MTNVPAQPPQIPVANHVGTPAVTTVGTATTFEQIMAGVLGLVTAGPLGAIASWGCIKGFQGKWGPWGMTGVVAAPALLVFQLGVLSASTPSPSSKTSTTQAETQVVAAAPAVPAAPRARFARSTWNQIESGMTKSQVEAILGRGELTSKTSMMGSTTELISYGSFLSNYGMITYSDGRVFSLSSNF